MATYYKYLRFSKKMTKRWKWTMDVFKNSRLFMGNYKEQNDPMEAIYEADADINPYIEDIRNAKPHTRMCCLSKVGTDVLMWAHYADSHKGCCVEFNIDSCTPSSSVHDDEIELVINPSMVKDIVYFPHIEKPKGNDYKEILLSILNHKLSPWEYEQEVRYVKLFWGDDIDRNTKVFLKVHITKVLLGCNLTSTKYNHLCQSIKAENSAIDVQQIKMRDLTYWDSKTHAHVKIF